VRLSTLCTALACLLAATTAQAQRITYDFDKATDFSRLTRYAWVRGTELADPLNHARVIEAVDDQLAAKGLRRVRDGEAPDVLVAYHATFERGVQLTGISTGWGPYRVGGWSGLARTEKYLTGTLVVDVIDAASRTIIWRGTARKEVDADADPERRSRNITRAAQRLFQRYPK
jgi:hypothetical protein